MKKILLLGCIATLFYTNTTQAQYTNTSVSIPTEQEVSTAFHSLLLEQGLGVPERLQVKAEGDNFTVTVPTFTTQISQANRILDRSIPEQNFTLTRNGSFNGKAQYNVEPFSLDRIQSIVYSLLPAMTIDSNYFNGQITWVPTFNLVSEYNLNSRDFYISIPNIFNITSKHFNIKYLTQIKNKKIDTTGSVNIQDMLLKTPFVTLNIPIFSQDFNWVKNDINDLLPINITGSTKTSNISLSMPGINQPVLSMAANVKLAFEKDANFMISLSNIKLASIFNIPSQLMPTEIQGNIIITDIDRFLLQKSLNLDKEQTQLTKDKIKNAAEIQRLERSMENIADQLIQKSVLNINPITLKNDKGYISIVGNIKNKKSNNGEWNSTFDLQMTIANLDAISPATQVDEKICAQAGISGNTEQAVACSPVGKFLNGLRSFSKPQNRTTDKNGNVIDTFSIQLKDNIVTINGQIVDQTKISGK